MRWNDGSKATFQNLGGCTFYQGDGVSSFIDAGQCTAGFVTISSPIGTKICSITKVGYARFVQVKGSGGVAYETGNCRYK